jgi:hypothetical protein
LTDRAAAIDYLQSSKHSLENIGITYFYFQHDDRGKSNEKVAMILLRNLVSQAKIIHPLLHKMFDDNKNAARPPKFDDIVELMISYFQYYTSIFVFFDALDETTEKQKEKVLDLIAWLCRSGMRVFLTSQPHLEARVQQLDKQLSTLVPYEIRAQESDLNVFIREELKNKHFDESFPDFPIEDKKKMQKTLIDNADGM